MTIRVNVSSIDKVTLPPPQSALTMPQAANRSAGYGPRFSYIRCLPQVRTYVILSAHTLNVTRISVVVTVSLETQFRMDIPNVLLTILGMLRSPRSEAIVELIRTQVSSLAS